MTFANAEAAEYWSEMAPTWLELEDRLDEVAGPPGQWAMERLGLEVGQRVLDVGCGLGRTTRALAREVGPEGRVVGLDISEGMLQAARDHAAQAGVANVEFVLGDAQVHELAAGAFDAAYSRFGVMFFADPVAAFANIHRSLRPGGRISFVCWQSGLENEWALVPAAAAMAALGVAPRLPGPEEPGPFSLADPARVRSILEGAGFSSVEVDQRNDFAVTTEADIPQVARMSLRVGGVRALLQDADEATTRRAVEAIEEAMRARLEDGEMKAKRGVNLVRAVA
jgi:SAM-dependent methyltransferase